VREGVTAVAWRRRGSTGLAWPGLVRPGLVAERGMVTAVRVAQRLEAGAELPGWFGRRGFFLCCTVLCCAVLYLVLAMMATCVARNVMLAIVCLLRSQVYTYAVMSALYSYGRCQQRTNSKQRSRSHGPI
jgi:hypothetical protein